MAASYLSSYIHNYLPSFGGNREGASGAKRSQKPKTLANQQQSASSEPTFQQHQIQHQTNQPPQQQHQQQQQQQQQQHYQQIQHQHQQSQQPPYYNNLNFHQNQVHFSHHQLPASNMSISSHMTSLPPPSISTSSSATLQNSSVFSNTQQPAVTASMLSSNNCNIPNMNMNSNSSHVYNTNTSHPSTLVNNNVRHNDNMNNNNNNDISFYNSNKAPILQQTTAAAAPVISARFDAYEDIFISNESEEYGLEISQFMSEMEMVTLPNPGYMEKQTEVNWRLRKTLVIWLIEVHAEYDLRPETLYLAINILDRVCSKRIISRPQYQLLGIAALWVAAKYEENHGRVPTLKNLIYICCNTYNEFEFKAMEQIILGDLEFVLGHPTPESFLKAHCRYVRDVPPMVRALARLIMEITLVHKRFLSFKPSLLATASLILADSIFHRKNWMHHDLVMAKILTHMEDCIGHPQRQIMEKYKSSKFLGVAHYMKSWIDERTMCNQLNIATRLQIDTTSFTLRDIHTGLLTPPKECATSFQWPPLILDHSPTTCPLPPAPPPIRTRLPLPPPYQDPHRIPHHHHLTDFHHHPQHQQHHNYSVSAPPAQSWYHPSQIQTTHSLPIIPSSSSSSSSSSSATSSLHHPNPIHPSSMSVSASTHLWMGVRDGLGGMVRSVEDEIEEGEAVLVSHDHGHHLQQHTRHNNNEDTEKERLGDGNQHGDIMVDEEEDGEVIYTDLDEDVGVHGVGFRRNDACSSSSSSSSSHGGCSNILLDDKESFQSSLNEVNRSRDVGNGMTRTGSDHHDGEGYVDSEIYLNGILGMEYLWN